MEVLMEESGWLLEKKAVLGRDSEMFDDMKGAEEAPGPASDGFARTISFRCDD
jgi:hypothetical protein